MDAPAPTPILAPSLLAGDHAMLAQSARQILEAGLTTAHVDVMDGHFVPNLTFGPQILADINRHVPELRYDVHLMLDNPGLFIAPFAKAGADLISIHIEPDIDHRGLLSKIRALGLKCGIVLNPDTPPERIRPLLGEVDLVLVMTVQPGYGGQPFRKEMLPKIKTIADWRGEMRLNFRIEVDGGIDLTTAPACVANGADILVAGTSFFHAPDKRRFAQEIVAHHK